MHLEDGGRLKSGFTAALLVASLGLGAPALAETLKGTVRNGTSGKPAHGDEVVAFAVTASGSTEIGRSTTDAFGRFRMTIARPEGSCLVRVIHQGLGYQAVAPAGARSVDVQVFDVAARLEGVTATADIRLEADDATLKVIEEFWVRNASDPPRTLRNEHPFTVQIPPEAQVLAGAMQAPGRQATKFKPVPGGQKGQYDFPLVLLPGESRFAIAYALPYKGEAPVAPRIPYPVTRLAVTIPTSMTFKAERAGLYEAKPDETWAIVRQMASPKPDQSAGFRVSGTGTLAKVQGAHRGVEPAQAAPGADGLLAVSHGVAEVRTERARPGAWDRRLVLGGFSIALVVGAAGVAVLKKKKSRRLFDSTGPAPAPVRAKGALGKKSRAA